MSRMQQVADQMEARRNVVCSLIGRLYVIIAYCQLQLQRKLRDCAFDYHCVSVRLYV